MGRRLPYHYEEGDVVLSLKYVTPTEEEADTAVENFLDRERPDSVKLYTEVQPYEFDDVLWAIYTAAEYTQPFPTGWEQGMKADEIVLVDGIVNTFRGVSDVWTDRGQPLKWYKQPQPREIVEAFERVQWRQPVATVGGEIVSNLVLKHCLPNANHRTSVAFLRTYLQSMAEDSNPDFPAAGNYEGDWHEWARGFVHESKRLLLLRRKPELLGHVKRYGCDEVYRKSGVKVDLSAHDFFDPVIMDMSEEAHRNRSIQFVRNYLTQSEIPELGEKKDAGKRIFIDRLR